MIGVADFPLHRPELLDRLKQGDALLLRAMDGSEKLFAAGTKLIRTGEPSDTVYRMATGWAARTRTLDDGRRSFITFFLPGDVFGVKSFLLARQADAVECLTDTTAFAIDHVSLRELFDSEPSVALRVAFQLGEDERRLHNYVIGLGRANAEERLVVMLLEFHGRLIRAGIVKDGNYRLPLTQQSMADFLGLTVVHVNRLLRRLREARIATVTNGNVVIHDMIELQKIAKPIQDIFEREQPEFGGTPSKDRP